VSYYEAQMRKMTGAEHYALKIQARGDNASGETHWMNASADQVARIIAIMSESDTVYEIVASDVGRATIHAFGRPWQVSTFLGQVLPGDVGKRVYRTRDHADVSDVSDVLQVENNEQRDRRLNKPTA
jgi:hypothetical protein